MSAQCQWLRRPEMDRRHAWQGPPVPRPGVARGPGQLLDAFDPAVQQWLGGRAEIHFHFTPKGASWLNMVEAWFGILTRKSVRRGPFDTVRTLVRHIDAYIADWNTHPTPFLWTKDPAAIVKMALGRGR